MIFVSINFYKKNRHKLINPYESMEPGEVILVVQEEDPNEIAEIMVEPGEPQPLSICGCIVGTIICLVALFGIVALLIDLYRILS